MATLTLIGQDSHKYASQTFKAVYTTLFKNSTDGFVTGVKKPKTSSDAQV